MCRIPSELDRCWLPELKLRTPCEVARHTTSMYASTKNHARTGHEAMVTPDTRPPSAWAMALNLVREERE